MLLMKRSRGKARRARRRILILCEGATEKNYFQAIKEHPECKQALSAIDPQVVAAKNTTLEQVVREAIQRALKARQENNAYDKVWVVFDHDNHAHRRAAYDKAIEHGYEVAFSAIAFEMWYLLHFIKTTRAFRNGDALIRELRKHYSGYEKARQNDFVKLKDKLEEGIQNAVWLRQQMQAEDRHTTDFAAWTDVDLLVMELISE